MKKFYNAIVFLGLLIFIISCNEEDPLLPLPEVDFRTNPEIVEVGVEVTFENLTTNASSYRWDFGDGQISEETNPKITYEASGNYTVKLVAFTDDNQKDSVTQEINVGERIMVELYINDVPFINSEGADWDDPTGLPDSTKYPDLMLFLGPTEDPEFLNTIITFPVTDLEPTFLPIIYTITGEDPLILTDEEWVIQFIDYDGVDINDLQLEDLELMGSFTFNPVQIATSAINEDGEGIMQLSAAQFSVDILFQIE